MLDIRPSCECCDPDLPAASTVGGSTRSSSPVVVRRVAAADTWLIEPLGHLLIDAVHSGASIGFLAPVSRETADRYWHRVFASLGGNLRLWVAEKDDVVVGTAQLSLCDKENGRHRAEVQKLQVLRAARGNGVATLLMGELEAEARRRRRSLLFLDTLLASHAEDVCRRPGWSRAGEIPDYATTPDGEPSPTVLYFRQLRA
jgi:acetyltransferase